MEKFNKQVPTKYGLIAFAFTLTIGMLMYVFYESMVKHFFLYSFIMFLSLAFALFLGIWSGITYRKENGGVISFAHAFFAVYIVFALYCVGSSTSMLLINKVIDTTYAEKLSSKMKESMSEYLEKNNVDEDKAKEALSKMGPEKFDPPLIDQFKMLSMWLGIFAVIAVIVAAFIKRGSGDLIESGVPPEPIKVI